MNRKLHLLISNDLGFSGSWHQLASNLLRFSLSMNLDPVIFTVRFAAGNLLDRRALRVSEAGGKVATPSNETVMAPT